MSTRGRQLQQSAWGQLDRLVALLERIDDEAAQRPCPGREKLGDGTVGTLAAHTAANYERIAAIVNQAGVHGHHQGGFDRRRALGQAARARAALAVLGTLTDGQLDAVPAAGSFRFCDGTRTLEQVVAGLLTHQGHQLDALQRQL